MLIFLQLKEIIPDCIMAFVPLEYENNEHFVGEGY
jgi:hypothetical protein